MESYYEKCGSCIYTDLDDKYLGKFYCTKRKIYQVATEKIYGCVDYICGHSDEEVENAREGKR